jgi:hypothetical protein
MRKFASKPDRTITVLLSSGWAPLLAHSPLRTGLEGFPFIRLEHPKTPHEKRGRGLMQNGSDLLDTDLLPIRTAVENHDRRRILHANVTKHPTSGWSIQQLREAFPFAASHKYLIFDRDQKFGFEVIAAVKAASIIPKRTSFRTPWQNSIATVGRKLQTRPAGPHCCAE